MGSIYVGIAQRRLGSSATSLTSLTMPAPAICDRIAQRHRRQLALLRQRHFQRGPLHLHGLGSIECIGMSSNRSTSRQCQISDEGAAMLNRRGQHTSTYNATKCHGAHSIDLAHPPPIKGGACRGGIGAVRRRRLHRLRLPGVEATAGVGATTAAGAGGRLHHLRRRRLPGQGEAAARTHAT